jgi:flavorubredoxin
VLPLLEVEVEALQVMMVGMSTMDGQVVEEVQDIIQQVQ